MIREIEKNLRNLGFNNNESKVYIALTSLGEAKASEIAKKAEVPRTTAISILDKLEKEGYITTHKYRGVTFYWIESPEVLVNTLKYKVDLANNLKDVLGNLYGGESNFPVSRVYDTKRSIATFIEKTISNLKRNSIIYTIDTIGEGNYEKIFSKDVNVAIAQLKRKRGIVTRTMISFGSFDDIAAEKLKGHDISVRELPEGMDFSASFWIVDNMIVHFSGNPPFLVTIKHPKIAVGMKGVYDFLWSIANSKN
ncbi:TrmB family transcriptional regulator [Patescibacteria group bacterium]